MFIRSLVTVEQVLPGTGPNYVTFSYGDSKKNAEESVFCQSVI